MFFLTLTLNNVFVDYVFKPMYISWQKKGRCRAGSIIVYRDWNEGVCSIAWNQLARKATFQNIFTVVYRSCLPCVNYVDLKRQNRCYERNKMCLDVTNLLVYNFKRGIIHEDKNCLTIFHDRMLSPFSGWLLAMREDDITPSRVSLLSNIAFVVNEKIGRRKVVREGENNKQRVFQNVWLRLR